MLVPRTDIDLHEQVSVADLLVLGGLAEHEGRAWGLIYHGQVKIEQWTIGIGDGTLPRWVLRGTTIATGDRSIRISDDGTHIMRSHESTLA